MHEGPGSLGLMIVAPFWAQKHGLVKPSDSIRVNKAFFTANRRVSLLLFITTSADILWRRMK